MLGEIKISDGDIKLNLDNGVKLNSNFNSKFDFDENLSKKYSKFFRKFNFSNNIKEIKADLNNNLLIDLDKTYKVKNYDYNLSGKVEKSKLKFKKIKKNNFVKEKLDQIFFSFLNIKTNINPKNISFESNGKYSFDKIDFFNINAKSNLRNDQTNLSLDFKYGNSLELALINYKKNKDLLLKLIFLWRKTKKKLRLINLITKKIKINQFND